MDGRESAMLSNITRYERLLKGETDPTTKANIELLLRAEKAQLAVFQKTQLAVAQKR
jgi:hypothetical protein